jgi:hypothetical protein
VHYRVLRRLSHAVSTKCDNGSKLQVNQLFSYTRNLRSLKILRLTTFHRVLLARNWQVRPTSSPLHMLPFFPCVRELNLACVLDDDCASCPPRVYV